MAACELKIELTEPNKVYVDGETIRGQVVVQSDKRVNTKGLQLTTKWSTHGRGNVASGDVDFTDVFQGTWEAGVEYRYPFELKTATWPPTYYGRQLNVNHRVEARAKLPWAFDPKAGAEFTVWASKSPENLAATNNARQSQWVWFLWPLVIVLLVVFGVMFLFLVPILLALGGGIWLFRSFLPTLRTGQVVCQIEPSRIRPGATLAGRMQFTPRVKTRINEINYKIVCEEKCVSGSGSNAKTYREELHSHSGTLMDSNNLLPGQPQTFSFEYAVPERAAPSLALPSNDLNWFVEFRIDIPRWPDYVRRTVLVVEPADLPESPATDEFSPLSGEPSWLDQVIEQLRKSAGDAEHLALVLGAIEKDEFDVILSVENSRSHPAGMPFLPKGRWFEAFDAQREVFFQLRFADDEPPPPANGTWRGSVAIIGYDPQEDEIIASAL